MKDFDSTYPSEYGCQNLCRQGRKRCPCPQACEVAEEQVHNRAWTVVKVALAVTAVLVVISAFVD